jgi:hypothetical protein
MGLVGAQAAQNRNSIELGKVQIEDHEIKITT